MVCIYQNMGANGVKKISSVPKICHKYCIEGLEGGEFTTTGEIRSGRPILLQSVHASCPEYIHKINVRKKSYLNVSEALVL